MSFDANEYRISQIFNGDSSFHIPRNQREYVWTEKNWKELADDIQYVNENIKSGRNITHFVGSFVFQKNDNHYTIIDGQQRITTFMLMLCAISLIQNEILDKDGFGRTKQYLLGDIGLSTQYQRLTNKSIENLELLIAQITDYKEDTSKIWKWKSILSSNSSQNKLIIQCFDYFYSFFVNISEKKIESISEIRKIILDMKVIHIVSEDELDCYEVFEILNARGVALKDSELIKNYIFKYVQPKYTVDIAKIKWQNITGNIDKCGNNSNNIEQFLEHYFTARFGKRNKNETIFELVKNKIEKTKIVDLLDELVKCSKYYCYFYNPTSYDNKVVSECLEFFKMENQRQFRPIFIAYFLAFEKQIITQSEMEKAFLYLRNFYFAFGLLCKNTSNIVESGVYTVANKIYNATEQVDSNIFTSVFTKYYPSEDTFVNAFIEKGYSNHNKLYTNSKNKKEIYYILKKFEEYFLNENGGELQISLDRCNIEHIMKDSEIDDIPCKIGNLLLISTGINSNCADKTFEEKLEKYKTSQLNNVKNFVKYYGKKEDWNYDLIKERSRRMAKLAYEKIWAFSVNSENNTSFSDHNSINSKQTIMV